MTRPATCRAFPIRPYRKIINFPLVTHKQPIGITDPGDCNKSNMQLWILIIGLEKYSHNTTSQFLSKMSAVYRSRIIREHAILPSTKDGERHCKHYNYNYKTNEAQRGQLHVIIHARTEEEILGYLWMALVDNRCFCSGI